LLGEEKEPEKEREEGTRREDSTRLSVGQRRSAVGSCIQEFERRSERGVRENAKEPGPNGLGTNQSKNQGVRGDSGGNEATRSTRAWCGKKEYVSWLRNKRTKHRGSRQGTTVDQSVKSHTARVEWHLGFHRGAAKEIGSVTKECKREENR